MSLLTPCLIARSIRKFALNVTHVSCSVEDIEKELLRVLDYYSKKVTHYNKDGDVYLVEVKITRQINETTHHRMRGELDPKTVKELIEDEKSYLALVKPYDVLCNSASDRNKIKGISLPENKSSIEECAVEDLKVVIICRGGSLTGKNGKSLSRSQLLLQVKASLKIETEKPSSVFCFDRSRSNNGMFSKIDTSKRRSLTRIINDLANNPSYEPNIISFFVDLLRYCKQVKCVYNFSTIALEVS